jgi:hypothetical protein
MPNVASRKERRTGLPTVAPRKGNRLACNKVPLKVWATLRDALGASTFRRCRDRRADHVAITSSSPGPSGRRTPRFEAKAAKVHRKCWSVDLSGSVCVTLGAKAISYFGDTITLARPGELVSAFHRRGAIGHEEEHIRGHESGTDPQRPATFQLWGDERQNSAGVIRPGNVVTAT